MTHNRDIVPSLPPMWVGFHHVATEVWQVDFELAHVSSLYPLIKSSLEIKYDDQTHWTSPLIEDHNLTGL